MADFSEPDACLDKSDHVTCAIFLDPEIHIFKACTLSISGEQPSRSLIMTTTVSAKPAEVRRAWYLVDADGKTLGRLASELALRLRGKHKPQYTPHVDTGDYLVVVNAEKVRVTGNKLQDKMYYRHTGYVGNLKSTNLAKLLETTPERAIQLAVKGMLPRGPLGRAMFRKLRVYAGPEHGHQAQQPQVLDLNV